MKRDIESRINRLLNFTKDRLEQFLLGEMERAQWVLGLLLKFSVDHAKAKANDFVDYEAEAFETTDEKLKRLEASARNMLGGKADGADDEE